MGERKALEMIVIVKIVTLYSTVKTHGNGMITRDKNLQPSFYSIILKILKVFTQG